MKKSPNKFAIRKETLRVLIGKELVLALGGNDGAAPQLLAAESQVKACDSHAN